MNRRAFFGLLGGGVAAAVAIAEDPDKALWLPGKKLISIPVPTVTVKRFPEGPVTVRFLCGYDVRENKLLFRIDTLYGFAPISYSPGVLEKSFAAQDLDSAYALASESLVVPKNKLLLAESIAKASEGSSYSLWSEEPFIDPVVSMDRPDDIPRGWLLA